jgi:hypothetical protein
MLLVENKENLTLHERSLYLAVLIAATLAGIYFRAESFLINTVLDAHTAPLAVSLIERDYLGLLNELPGEQSAPSGFMMFSKFISSPFDYSERSLYAVTFSFSVLALLAFLYLTIYLLGYRYAILGFLPMAFSTGAIFYAGQDFKQYSSELFFCTVILIFCCKALKEGFTNRIILSYIIIGVVSPWFSLTSIIFLSGTAVALLVYAIRNRDQHNFLFVLCAGFFVFLHYVALYEYQIRPAMPDFMEHYWKDQYGPIHKPLTEQLIWWVEKWFKFFQSPLGFPPVVALIAILACLTGIWSLAKLQSKRLLASVLLLPVLVFVILIYAQKFPFGVGSNQFRMSLFLTPIFYVLIAIGVRSAIDNFKAKNVLTIATSAVLCFSALHTAISDPIIHTTRDMRSLHAYLTEVYQPGDQIYADQKSLYAFKYYNRFAQLPYSGGGTVFTNEWHWDMRKMMDTHQRIWIAISTGKGKKKFAYEQFLAPYHAPVEIIEFEKAWLVLSDPAKAIEQQ